MDRRYAVDMLRKPSVAESLTAVADAMPVLSPTNVRKEECISQRKISFRNRWSERSCRSCRAPDFRYEDEQRVVQGLQQRLGETVTIAVERVSAIPAEQSGKYRYVVSKI